MSFTDTIRESIIQSIITGLEGIRTASGYNVDSGQNVIRARTFNDKDNLPAIGVFPLPETNAPIPGKNVLEMPVRLEASAKFGSTNASVFAEAILGDLIKRMTDPSLSDIAGGYADSVQYAEGGVDDYPKAGQYTIGVYAIFNVKYKTLKGNPYTQS